jgi:hypothetical protein
MGKRVYRRPQKTGILGEGGINKFEFNSGFEILVII